MKFQVISENKAVQAAYVAMRRGGESHAIAEMLALRQAPFLVTDSVFMAGIGENGQFEKNQLLAEVYRKRAEEAGQSVSGKVYLSGLAEYPGDPRAWVSGRGDVQRVCEERGWGCRGFVNVKRRDAGEPPAQVDVAEDILGRETEAALAGVPEGERSPKVVAEAREKVRQRIKPHWSR